MTGHGKGQGQRQGYALGAAHGGGDDGDGDGGRGEGALQIAVCGPAEASELEYRQAYEIGGLLAQRGAVVLCGGYGGVMAAAAAGARQGGGTAVGILSRADREEANPDLTITIATGMGQARNAVIVNSADAVVVVGVVGGRCRRSRWRCVVGFAWCA